MFKISFYIISRSQSIKIIHAMLRKVNLFSVWSLSSFVILHKILFQRISTVAIFILTQISSIYIPSCAFQVEIMDAINKLLVMFDIISKQCYKFVGYNCVMRLLKESSIKNFHFKFPKKICFYFTSEKQKEMKRESERAIYHFMQ